MGAAGTLTQAPRLVLDTDVLVSALILGGGFAWPYEAWQKERIRPLASRATVSELIRVLAYPKFRLSAEERETLLAEYLPWCESVVVPDSTRVPDRLDPGDVVFLQLAMVGRADALVSGDRPRPSDWTPPTRSYPAIRPPLPLTHPSVRRSRDSAGATRAVRGPAAAVRREREGGPPRRFGRPLAALRYTLATRPLPAMRPRPRHIAGFRVNGLLL